MLDLCGLQNPILMLINNLSSFLTTYIDDLSSKLKADDASLIVCVFVSAERQYHAKHTIDKSVQTNLFYKYSKRENS